MLYMALSFLSVVLSMLEIFAVKSFIQGIENWDLIQPKMFIVQTAILVAVIMNLGGIIWMYIPLSMSKLNEVELYEKERLLLTKSTDLQMSDAESPAIQDLRERAFQYSPYNTFTKGISWINSSVLIVTLLVILTIAGHWLLTVGLCLLFIIQLKLHTKAAEALQFLTTQQTGSKRLIDYYVRVLTEKEFAKELRLFRFGGYIKKKWLVSLTDLHQSTLRITIKGEILKVFPNMLVAVVGGIIALIIMILVDVRHMGVSDFTLLFQVSTILISNLTSTSQNYGQLRADALKCADFKTYQSLENDPLHSENTEFTNSHQVNKAHLSVALNVDHLSFQYPDPSAAALYDLSFSIADGQRVAFVGENGSGKTTLIMLLLGLYKPDNGQIQWRVDHNPISFSELHQLTSVVFQDYVKLNTTVRENITIGDVSKHGAESDLTDALIKAGAIQSFPNLNERLGTAFDGREPSGGQWQKLATARAYLRNGICMIYDEPTAALDAKAELENFRSFLDLANKRTVIMVTHRLGAARYADKIIVLKEGRLVEEGTHQQLLTNNGEYRRLYDMQSAWYQ